MSREAQLHNAPWPKPVIRVGVTGHRPNRLQMADDTNLAASIRQVLLAIHSAAKAAAIEPVKCVILSSLAEGADRIAATIALEHDLGFQLEVPLPMPKAEYEADFETDTSKAEFRSLLSKATSCYVLPSSSTDRSLSYLAAGEMILAQCDLLLGISDGEESAGIGGTSDMLGRAQAQAIPTVIVSATRPHSISFKDAQEPLISLASEVRRLLAPPDQLIATMHEFRNERWPKHHPFLAHVALRLFGDRQVRFPPHPDFFRQVNEIHSPSLKRYFLWADTLATYHGERSRSASLRLQLLATLAVLAALVNVSFAEYPLTTRVLSVLEVASTLWLLYGVAHSRRGHWHDRWLRCRAIAEQLRSVDILWPLGLPARSHYSRDLSRESEAHISFESWLLRAVQRELGIPNEVVDRSFLRLHSQHLRTVIGNQIDFHRKASTRYKAAEAALRRCGLTLFSLAFLLGIYDVCHAFELLPATVLRSFALHSTFEPATRIATVLLPALGAAVTAIVAQGEYKRLAEQSDAMSHRLITLRSQFHGTAEMSYQNLCTLSSNVADVLLFEVQEWSMLVASKPPSLPV